MNCSHCFSLMIEMEHQQDSRTTQTRFECPTCGRGHLVTRQTSLMNLRLDTLERVAEGKRYWREKLG